MENNNFWIITIAVVAVVAIVAVFGMVNITGYAIKEKLQQTPRTCEMFFNECLLSTVDGTQNCQKCCALGFACNIQLGVMEDAKYRFSNCMDGCNVDGGKDSCSRITDCPTCKSTTGCCWRGTGECFKLEPGTLCLDVPCDETAPRIIE